MGDRGPSSLDWAIELGADRWGVTVLEATDEVDGGDVWASRTFRMREAGKSSLYRHEVRTRGDRRRRAGGPRRGRRRRRADPARLLAPGRLRPPAPADPAGGAGDRLDADETETVLRRIRAAEGHPGVLDSIEGEPFHLFGGHREGTLRGRPGEIVAQRHGAICRATVDGAVGSRT